MSRVLILAVAVVVFFWLLRRALGSRGGPDAPAQPRAPAAIPDLVECARCGVLLPKDEALTGGEAAKGAAAAPAARYFCCEEHRRLGPG